MKADLGAIDREYEKLKEQLSGIGWMSAGYVQDRGPGAGGPCYQWTRKEKGKTVSLALSKEQYEAMREAIEGWREVEAILDRMQQLTDAVAHLREPAGCPTSQAADKQGFRR